MIKYWKQWRAWVKHKEAEREEDLVRYVVYRIDQFASDPRTCAQCIIDAIRDHRKPW